MKHISGKCILYRRNKKKSKFVIDTGIENVGKILGQMIDGDIETNEDIEKIEIKLKIKEKS